MFVVEIGFFCAAAAAVVDDGDCCGSVAKQIFMTTINRTNVVNSIDGHNDDVPPSVHPLFLIILILLLLVILIFVFVARLNTLFSDSDKFSFFYFWLGGCKWAAHIDF